MLRDSHCPSAIMASMHAHTLFSCRLSPPPSPSPLPVCTSRPQIPFHSVPQCPLKSLNPASSKPASLPGPFLSTETATEAAIHVLSASHCLLIYPMWHRGPWPAGSCVCAFHWQKALCHAGLAGPELKTESYPKAVCLHHTQPLGLLRGPQTQGMRGTSKHTSTHALRETHPSQVAAGGEYGQQFGGPLQNNF